MKTFFVKWTICAWHGVAPQREHACGPCPSHTQMLRGTSHCLCPPAASSHLRSCPQFLTWAPASSVPMLNSPSLTLLCAWCSCSEVSRMPHCIQTMLLGVSIPLPLLPPWSSALWPCLLSLAFCLTVSLPGEESVSWSWWVHKGPPAGLPSNPLEPVQVEPAVQKPTLVPPPPWDCPW